MNFTLPDTFNHDPPDVLDTPQTCAREQNSIFVRRERLDLHRLKQVLFFKLSSYGIASLLSYGKWDDYHTDIVKLEKG